MIDQIRAQIFSPDQTNNSELVQLAGEYATSIKKANERLNRCADFLSKGLRTQAIQISEAEPDLLELVDVLNFAELDEWQDLVGTYGIQRFQPLRIDVANSVSHSYEEERRLSGILRRHRWLAIAKAPTKDRLLVLRQLMEMDSTATYWRNDVAELENLRIKELLELSNRASKNNDFQLLHRMVREYESERWSRDVPQSLRDHYYRLARHFHEATTLPRLATAIGRAHVNHDVQRLGQLLDEWREVTKALTEYDPRWQPVPQYVTTVCAAFSYFEQQMTNARHEAFQRDIAVLFKAINDEQSNERIDALLAAVDSHGFPLPASVIGAVAEFRGGVRDAKILNVAVIVTLVMAGIAGIVFVFFMAREKFLR